MIEILERYGWPVALVGAIWALESVVNIIDTIRDWL
jgi:hypothetical protein